MYHLRLLIISLLISITSGFAQSGEYGAGIPAQVKPPVEPVWFAVLPSGIFSVSRDKLTSAGIHEYTVDNVWDVTEFSIAVDGSVLARFYYMKRQKSSLESKIPTSLNPENALEIVGKEVPDLQKQKSRSETKIMKSYPTSTHAHTVEYRLESRDDVMKIQEHFFKWAYDRGSNVFKLQ